MRDVVTNRGFRKKVVRPTPDDLEAELAALGWLRYVEGVALTAGLSVRRILSADQTRRVVRARHEAMAAIRDFTGASYPEIGRAFGRDHTTVLAGVRRADALRPRPTEAA